MSGNHLTVPHAFSLGLTSPCGTYERHDKMFPALQGPEKMGKHLERETEKSEKKCDATIKIQKSNQQIVRNQTKYLNNPT